MEPLTEENTKLKEAMKLMEKTSRGPSAKKSCRVKREGPRVPERALSEQLTIVSEQLRCNSE